MIKNNWGRGNKMKNKKWVLVAFLMVTIVSLCACGEKKELVLDINELADALQSGIVFEDQMSSIDLPVFYALYNLTEEEVADAVMIGSTGATAEEIAVIQAISPEMLEKVKTAVVDRIEFQKSGFENYVPAELDKLSKPVVEVMGNYVVLCVSDDEQKAREIISEYITE